jgi:hypothetical protein
MKERIHVKTPVTKVVRRDGRVVITSARGDEEFDHVIFATHADTSLELIKDISVLEKDVLSSFEFSKNVASLHSDLRVHHTLILLIIVNAQKAESVDVMELYHSLIRINFFLPEYRSSVFVRSISTKLM